MTVWMRREQVWSLNQGAEFSHRRKQMELARKVEEEVIPYREGCLAGRSDNKGLRAYEPHLCHVRNTISNIE
jgi:hypothetical protein